MSNKIIKKLKGAISINGDMAQNGILLLIFSLLLLAVKQVSETPIWGLIPILRLIPPPPVCFSTALRIILIVIFMIIVFWIWPKYKLASFLKGRLKPVAYLIICLLLLFILWLIPRIPVSINTIFGIIVLAISVIFMIAVFCKGLACKLKGFSETPFYWYIFWWVYIFGWLKGMSSVSGESPAFPLVVYLGFFWFVVITIVWYKAIAQSGKN